MTGGAKERITVLAADGQVFHAMADLSGSRGPERFFRIRPKPPAGVPNTLFATDEGITWIRGHLGRDDEAVGALKVANAL